MALPLFLLSLSKVELDEEVPTAVARCEDYGEERQVGSDNLPLFTINEVWAERCQLSAICLSRS